MSIQEYLRSNYEEILTLKKYRGVAATILSNLKSLAKSLIGASAADDTSTDAQLIMTLGARTKYKQRIDAANL